MNIRALLVPLLATGIAGSPLLRADLDIQGPVLGYYVAPAGYVLHAIAGVAGSATLGPSLATDLDALWIGPDSRTALGLRGGMIYLLRDIRNTTSRLPLTAWTGAVDNVVWSSDSSGVVFYSADRHILQAATGLHDNPVVSGEQNIASLGGTPLNFRLSASPWNLALVVRGGSAPARRAPPRRPSGTTELLYLMPALGSPLLVNEVSRPGPMDFSADAKTLYVVDQAADRLTRISGSTGELMQAVSLRSPDLLPSNFTDLAVSPDGGRLLVLDKKLHAACGIDIASGNSAFCTSLDFVPDGMKHLSGSLYLLDAGGVDAGAAAASPLWLLDGDLGRSFFVPMGSR